MKRTLTYILFSIFLLLMLLATSGDSGKVSVLGDSVAQASSPILIADTKDEKPAIIPKPDPLPGPIIDEYKDPTTIKERLTAGVLPKIAVTFAGVLSGIALLFIIVGGVRFVTAYGNEEAVETAKKQVMYGLIGLLVALFSYSIVKIIVNIDFEKAAVSFLDNTAYAATTEPWLKEEGEISIDELVPVNPAPGGDEHSEIETLENLPKVSMEQFIAGMIKTILGWAMSLTIIAIVVAGIFYIKSKGEEEQISKAKGIIIYLLIGMAIMAGAYGIVTGITQFDFFK